MLQFIKDLFSTNHKQLLNQAMSYEADLPVEEFYKENNCQTLGQAKELSLRCRRSQASQNN